MSKAPKIEKLSTALNHRLLGKEKLIDEVILALIAGGHILLEDVPGLGKTTLAKALSEALALSFSRIQLTPDTLPGDITGSVIFDKKEGDFRTVIGPIMSSIVLADELNRTGPKTQAALLEAMEERQITIDKNTYPLPEPFFVIATQNPLGAMGTYPLPEAELDRFMMKRSVGYPEQDAAIKLGRSYLDGELTEPLEPVMDADDIKATKDAVKKIKVSDELISYAVAVIESTRACAEAACGCSPRAELDLLRASQARAYMSDREYVIPEDIYDSARCVLPHRLILTSEARMDRIDPSSVIDRVLAATPIPE